MGLVNQTLPGLYNGVSQQPHELRLDTQVTEMLNCHPSIVEGVQKRQPTIHVADGNLPNDNRDVFIHSYDRGAGDERYVLLIQDGAWIAFDADTGLPANGKQWATDSYLDTGGKPASESFALVTVGDTTFVTNKTKVTSMDTIVDQNGDSDWETTLYMWIKRTTEIRYGASGESSKGYSYYVYNNNVAAASTTGSDGTSVCSSLASSIGASAVGSVLKKTNAQTYSISDSWGGQATEGWVGKIKKLQDLPSNLGFPGAIIEITGDEKSNFDNFYVKFDGVYKETFRPGLMNTINPLNMPMNFKRNADGGFGLSAIDWESRKVGDADSAPDPSFIGNTIEDVFFYKNRLGFLSGDNIILSETGDYYNFFPTTVTDVLDSDPIDVAVDSNHAVHLAYAVPFNKELLIFGDKAQFVLSASETLSPKDVNIQQSTAYSINNSIAPITLGPNVFFVTDRQNSSIVREYYVVPDTSNNSAANITSHCPSYIPKGLIKMVGSEKHDMLFAITGTDNKIYVYNYYWQGDEKAQSAWHTWEIEPGTIVFSITVINNNLMVFVSHTNGSNTTNSLETINLELPSNFNALTYKDHGTADVKSRIELSQWGIPSGQGNVDSNRSSLILRDLKLSMGENSHYGIEVSRSGVSSTTLSYNPTTRTPLNNHKYSVVGNTNNLKIALVSNTDKGFKLNSLSWRGQLHLKGSRGI